ncbi:MAG: two-component system, NtrC family, response regulator AtoC [Myxococcales bacterium]|jgi:CheY-like chemotaxis protein/HD-like signal output (HDOD) protein|nr:two-component system, NtrC family, response regulator AtoC [Myxococcales bacterium]
MGSGARPDRPLVLVVDDDLLIRRSLQQNLRRLGCDVLLAEDGNRALEIAAASHPAVIFLDLRMPGLDGYAVLRRLPAMGSQSSVIVMSGHGQMDDVIDAVRNGAIDYLRKPWKTTELAAALSRALALHQAFDPSVLEQLSSPHGMPGYETGSAAIAEVHPWTATFMAAAPATLLSLRRMVREDHPALESVVSAVSPDARLIHALLILANAGSRSPDTFVHDLSGVALRLGAIHVLAVAEALALRDICQAGVPILRTRQERIWHFSIAKAISMRAIAEVTGPEITLDPDRCCVSGLLMDVGATFLLWRLAEQPVTAVDQTGDAPLSLLVTNHARLGQGLIGAWGLPADLAGSVGTHHAEIPPISDEPFWCAGVLAGTMAARMVGFEDPTWTQPPRAAQFDRCCYRLGIGETVIRRLCGDLAADVADASNALR